MGGTDAFGNAHDALGAPRMRRSDAGAANKFDASRISAVWPKKTFSFIVNSVKPLRLGSHGARCPRVAQAGT